MLHSSNRDVIQREVGVKVHKTPEIKIYQARVEPGKTQRHLASVFEISSAGCVCRSLQTGSGPACVARWDPDMVMEWQGRREAVQSAKQASNRSERGKEQRDVTLGYLPFSLS